MLNRPDRRNAITGELGIDLAQALEQAEADDAVQAVLLCGAGGAFCSGLDLDAFNAEPAPGWMSEWPAIWRRAHRALYNCGKPIVCALERYAINGGAALAIASDFMVAGNGAFLQVGEVRIGMAAPYNLAWLGLRHGEATSMRIALRGDRVHGPELARLGIATESVPDDAVYRAATDLTMELAGFPAGAAARIKRGFRAGTGIDVDAYFDRIFATAAGGARPPRR